MTESNRVQLVKLYLLILSIFSGRLIRSRLLQFLKAESPIVIKLLLNLILVRLEQYANAALFIFMQFSGIFILSNDIQLYRRNSGISFKESDNSICFRLVQFSNVFLPNVITSFKMITLSKLIQLIKAESPMLETLFKLMFDKLLQLENAPLFIVVQLFGNVIVSNDEQL